MLINDQTIKEVTQKNKSSNPKYKSNNQTNKSNNPKNKSNNHKNKSNNPNDVWDVSEFLGCFWILEHVPRSWNMFQDLGTCSKILEHVPDFGHVSGIVDFYKCGLFLTKYRQLYFV